MAKSIRGLACLAIVLILLASAKTSTVPAGYSVSSGAGEKGDHLDLVVYPNGTVSLGGSINATNTQLSGSPLVNASLGFSTGSNVTTCSANGTAVLESNTWPYNSSAMNFSELYKNGILNASLGANTVIPEAITGSPGWPTNSSDFSFNSTYSNELLESDLHFESVLPSSISSQTPFNVSDLTIMMDYNGLGISGNITFHALAGFPFSDIMANINGDKTGISLTGTLNVVYGNYSAENIDLTNETSLRNTVANLTSTLVGSNGLIANSSWNFLECTRLDTTITPLYSAGHEFGAQVNYDAVVSGNFTGFLATLLAQTYSPNSPDDVFPTFYAALDSALSSIKGASFVLNYYHVPHEVSGDLEFTGDAEALWTKALEIVPATVPLNYTDEVQGWLKIANATSYAVKDFSLGATYVSATRRLDLNAQLLINDSQLQGQATSIMPEAVPSQWRGIVESYLNTTYCKMASDNISMNYADGKADFAATWILQGDFKAQVEHEKQYYVDILNETLSSTMSPSWELRMLNATEINMDNFKMRFEMGKSSVYFAFEGLILQPQKDNLDSIRFRLRSFLEMANYTGTLMLNVTGGSDSEQTVILSASSATTPPNSTATSYNSMVWKNASLASLDDLTFETAYNGNVNYGGKTYGVPIFTNSTISNLGINHDSKTITFNVTGPPGKGFCNLTIPRSLIYANATDWIVRVDGNAIPLGAINVTGNADYTFIYFTYAHSTHMITVQGTWFAPISEYQPNFVPLVLTALALVTVAITVHQRRRLKTFASKQQFAAKAFAFRLH